LKDLGKENVTEEQLVRISQLLQNEDKENIVKDFVLMPIWIRQLILKAYE
jgi:hypothetical protein